MEPDRKDDQEVIPPETAKIEPEAKTKLASVFWDVVSFAVVAWLFETSWNNGVASLFCRLTKMNYSQSIFIMAFLYIFSRFVFTISSINKIY